jgi:hypothetical protein
MVYALHTLIISLLGVPTVSSIKYVILMPVKYTLPIIATMFRKYVPILWDIEEPDRS